MPLGAPTSLAAAKWWSLLRGPALGGVPVYSSWLVAIACTIATQLFIRSLEIHKTCSLLSSFNSRKRVGWWICTCQVFEAPGAPDVA